MPCPTNLCRKALKLLSSRVLAEKKKNCFRLPSTFPRKLDEEIGHHQKMDITEEGIPEAPSCSFLRRGSFWVVGVWETCRRWSQQNKMTIITRKPRSVVILRPQALRGQIYIKVTTPRDVLSETIVETFRGGLSMSSTSEIPNREIKHRDTFSLRSHFLPSGWRRWLWWPGFCTFFILLFLLRQMSSTATRILVLYILFLFRGVHSWNDSHMEWDS